MAQGSHAGTAPRVAIVLAAGLGRRMGGDKATLDVGGVSLLERAVKACVGAGVDRLVVVRRKDADPIPVPDAAIVVEVSGDGDMTASIVAGREALRASSPSHAVVLHVDHAMVAADTVAGVLALVTRVSGAAIGLPLWRGRPGHPVALSWDVLDELGAPSRPTLRDVVRADPARVRVVETNCPWTVRDLDDPAILRAARASLREDGWAVSEQMHRHRSRRSFSEETVSWAQLACLVDAARHASTSSFIQACSVVAVTDAAVRDRCAVLCGDQDQIRQAPVFAAICADAHRLAAACDDQGVPFAADDFELFVQVTVDAALVGQNLQLAAEAEGLGACMIGGARNHPDEIAELLGLPAHAYVVFGMTLGHPIDDPVPRTRMPLAGILHAARYDGDASVRAAADADEQMRAWARAVNAAGAGRPVRDDKGWRDRMAAAWAKDGRYVAARAGLARALRARGFLSE